DDSEILHIWNRPKDEYSKRKSTPQVALVEGGKRIFRVRFIWNSVFWYITGLWIFMLDISKPGTLGCHVGYPVNVEFAAMSSSNFSSPINDNKIVVRAKNDAITAIA
ncbi:26056_t:CDS:2, partial [Racocetra persica]